MTYAPCILSRIPGHTLNLSVRHRGKSGQPQSQISSNIYSTGLGLIPRIYDEHMFSKLPLKVFCLLSCSRSEDQKLCHRKLSVNHKEEFKNDMCVVYSFTTISSSIGVVENLAKLQ